MTIRHLIFVLLLLSLPAVGQDQQFSDVAAKDDITVAEVDSMIEATSSREDLDDETMAQVLEMLRDARAQIQIRLDAEAAAAGFAASLNTAPARLEELRT